MNKKEGSKNLKNKSFTHFQIVKPGYIKEKEKEYRKKGCMIFYRREHYFSNIPSNEETHYLKMTFGEAKDILDDIMDKAERKFKRLECKITLDVNDGVLGRAVLKTEDEGYKVIVNVSSLFPEYVAQRLDLSSLAEDEIEKLLYPKEISDLEFCRLIHTAFHELRHVEQIEMTKKDKALFHRGVKTADVQRMAEEQIVSYKNDGLYNCVYDCILTEIDANRFGYEDGTKYLRSMLRGEDAGIRDIIGNCMDRVAWEDLTFRYSYEEAMKGHLYSRDDFIDAYKKVGQRTYDYDKHFWEKYMEYKEANNDQLKEILDTSAVGKELTDKLSKARNNGKEPMSMLAGLLSEVDNNRYREAINSGALRNLDLSMETMWGISSEKLKNREMEYSNEDNSEFFNNTIIYSLDNIIEQAREECLLNNSLDREIEKDNELEFT